MLASKVVYLVVVDEYGRIFLVAEDSGMIGSFVLRLPYGRLDSEDYREAISRQVRDDFPGVVFELGEKVAFFEGTISSECDVVRVLVFFDSKFGAIDSIRPSICLAALSEVFPEGEDNAQISEVTRQILRKLSDTDVLCMGRAVTRK